MSEGKPKLFGKALAKVKKLSKVAHLRNKKKNDESICSASSLGFLDATDVDSSIKQKNVKEGNCSADSEFVGFSPVEPMSYKHFFKSTPVLSENDPFLGFSPQGEFNLKRRSVNFESRTVYGTDIPITPILAKRKSLTFSSQPNVSFTPAVSHNVKPIAEPTILITVATLPIRPFFKIVLGDFSQFSSRFPYPHHQCSAMSATALAYNTLKSIDLWDAKDINTILCTGQTYYEECLLNLQLNQEFVPNGYLEAVQLNETLSIRSEDIAVKIDLGNIRGGPYCSAQVLRETIEHFEMNNFVNGILTYKESSYALLRHRNSIHNAYNYVFFDSHGRNVDGSKVGDRGFVAGKAAILFFHNANDFIHFFLQQYPLLGERSSHNLSDNLHLVPIHLGFDRLFTPTMEAPVEAAEIPMPIEQQSTNITVSSLNICNENNALQKIISIPRISSEINNSGDSFCLALSLCVMFSIHLDDIDCLTEFALNGIFDIGIFYWSHCNENAIEKRLTLPLTNIHDFVPCFVSDGVEFDLKVDAHTRCINTFASFERNLSYFYVSSIYSFAVLKIGGENYGLAKCKRIGHLIFYDAHGRTVDGVRPGKHSTVICFPTLNNFTTFMKTDITDWGSSTLDYIRFVSAAEENCGNLYARVVSGAFAQNDVRFGVKSRNTQCTANSVVFLAFASVFENDWVGKDVDSILELGDHIYTTSYKEATAIAPRYHTFLAAHEVKRNIFVNVSRLNRGVIIVDCKPLPEKSFNGKFGRDAQQEIDLFFGVYNYGVLICRSLSVALFKFQEHFLLFDPHARSVGGKLGTDGTANIFFFSNIPALYQFLCLCGYNESSEFTLTPFVVTHVDANSMNRQKNVPPPSHRPSHGNELGDCDSYDNIPIVGSDEWSARDNIPLIQLNDSSEDESDNVPLINFVKRNNSQVQPDIPAPTAVKSLPIFEARAERKMDKKREKIKYQKRKTLLALSTPEEENLRQRWKAYLKKIRRTHTPNIYESFDKFKEWFHTHKDDGSDDEIVQAAITAQDEYERSEQTRLLRLQNNAAVPTHFQAFGNHEDIDETDQMHALYKLSPMDKSCPHCGALYFKEECNSRNIFATCCNSGQVHSELPQKQAQNYPHLLRELLLNQSPLSRHFMDNIMLFNNILSFGSLGTTTVHHMQARGSLGPVIAMEGMIYHIAEHFHTNSTGVDMPTAQLYYIDTNVAVAERQARAAVTLNRGLLMSLENFMRAHNPLAGAYRMLKDVLAEVNRRPNATNTDVHLQIVRNRNQLRIRQNHGGDFSVPTSNEVAAVYTHAPLANNKNIVVFPVGQTPDQGIPLVSHDPNRDAMMYPILFPHSEQTWSYTLRRRTKEEVAELNAPPGNEEQSEVETTESEPENEPESEPEDDGRESKRTKRRVRITVREFFTFLLMLRVAFSPILNAGKLTQQFFIDAYSRAQDNTFEYLQSDRGQAQIRAETYGALKDYVDRKNVFQPDLPGKLIVMPNDIVGSRQYMKQRYADALAIVARFGKPTFFITMTCNPMWDEIQNRIPKGTNPVDRPDIVARVFKAKVKELIRDISERHILGRCVAYLAVIEWQKRSLPHCHLVSFNAPEDRPATDVDIDSFVSAEIPQPYKDKKSQRVYDYVTMYMYHHRCDNPTRKESCRVPRKGTFACPRHPTAGEQVDNTRDCNCYVCSKHFPHNFTTKSQLIEGGYPIYRRRMNGRKFVSSKGQDIDNRWIVPYNPYLLLKYNCHINVEITSSLKSIKYLFKYLHKGLDMARLNINVVDNVQVYNEFEHFLDCRYLSAGEAAWKLFKFPMFYQSHTIYSLPVHLENYQNVIFDPKNPEKALEHADSQLTAYFELNNVDERARQFFYTDIPLHYVFDKPTKTWTWRKRRHNKTLSRLYVVNYNNVELYSLRLLLLSVKGALSYEHLRNVDGIQYDTFREAAVALGLLDGDELLIQTFEEIIDIEMPYRIRCLFANMLIFNTPTDSLAIWERFKNHMFEDYVRKGCSDELSENLALRHISNMLHASHKSNSDFFIPEPEFAQDYISQCDSIDDDTLINLADEALQAQRCVELLHDEQRAIFDEIMDSVNNPNDPNKHRLFFVDGPGGSGKTFMFSTLITTLNGMGLKVLPIAWTGIAASLLKGGRTAHSAFKLPFNIEGKIACNLSTSSDAASEMRTATVIVWDEISMTICHALDAVNTFFQDLMGNNLPFGGKIFVATGDFRQILPVVTNGSKIDLLKVMAKRAKVWPLLQKRSLRTNLRLANPNDMEFAELLLKVGEGKVNDFPANEYFGSYVKIPQECVEENSIIDRIYGKTFSSSSVDHYSKYGIMTTLNEDVSLLNKEIYNRMTEEVSTEHTYLSTDSVIGLDPNDDDAYDVSMLNALEPPNLPPHILTLKENCIVMLLCNINPAQGLCNGTRLVVTKLYRTCIRAKILTGNFKGEEVLLSRCRMTTDTLDVSCKVQRTQIPVKLGYAMTINKAQGQSFDVAGVYFKKPPFSHGHLYVALSRARSKEKLIVQVLPDPFMGKLRPGSNDVFVPNIVYTEAL